MFYVCFGFCSFSTSLHQRNGQMGRRPVLTNAFRSHFVTESTDAQSIRDGALCPDHQPSVHLEEQTVIASAIIPMKHFQACEEICSCQSGVEQEAGGGYPSAWVKTVTNSSFSVTSGLHFSKCIRSSVYSMHAEDLHIKITWVVSHSEHTHNDILTFFKNACSFKALNGFLLNLSLLMRHLWNFLQLIDQCSERMDKEIRYLL